MLILTASLAVAQKPQKVIGPGEGLANFRVPFIQPAGTNRVLSKDTVYILTGWYFVDSLASMTIQPGTLVLGDSSSGATLIVRRGGKISAGGTASSPIVFTSRKAPGQRRPGDWGGVILLGNAPTNKPSTQQIEGGFGTIPNTNAMYGGADPNDSSGVMQYVRIEFAGIAFAQDNEINGLTFGGVGQKTVIDHIQVSFANDDDYEFFGGTIQAKYLIGWRSLDDCFDTDFGFSGRLQFCFTKRDPNIFDASASGSSNGFESDNEASAPYDALPRTKARFSNMTLVGPAADSTAAKALDSHWGNTSMLRRATELSIYNSVLVGWKNGINLRDTLTQRAAIDGRLEIRNTSIAVPTTPIVASSSPTTGNIAGFDPIAWFKTPAFGNNGDVVRQATDIVPATAFNLDNTFNPVSASNSEIATAGTAYNVGRLAGDSWFTPASYRGAFDPSLPMSQQWTAGWTNFDPQNTDYSKGVTAVSEEASAVPAQFELNQNYPNPFNPSTVIAYSLPQASDVTLKVYDMLGREVRTLVDGFQEAGIHRAVFDSRNLSSGVYLYRVSAGAYHAARTMVLLK
jgi:hypothetical protein